MSPVVFIRIAMVLMFLLPGVLSLWVGIVGCNWFFSSRGTQFADKRLGRIGARVFYAFLGIMLILCGIWGIINAPNVQ